MHITPLELGLAVLAVFLIFGPKRLPRFERPSREIELPPLAHDFYTRAQAPSFGVPANRAPWPDDARFAAGRAPSPLAARSGAHGPSSSHLFAATHGDSAIPAPLPHELPNYGAGVRKPVSINQNWP